MKRPLFFFLNTIFMMQLAHGVELDESVEPEATKATSGYPIVLPKLLDSNEAEQHKQLSLSLRNQRLLEQQAESRAKQLLFQLQAAEAWAAIQRLGGEFVNAKGPQATVLENDIERVPERFLRYRVHALVNREGLWVARVNNGSRMITLRDGDLVVPGIVAKVNTSAVEFIADNWRYKLSMD